MPTVQGPDPAGAARDTGPGKAIFTVVRAWGLPTLAVVAYVSVARHARCPVTIVRS